MPGNPESVSRQLPGPDWLWAMGGALAMLASYVIAALALGLDLFDHEQREVLIPVDTGFWAAIMTSIIFGLSLFFTAHGPRLDARALKRLPVDPARLDDLAATLAACLCLFHPRGPDQLGS